MAGRCTGSAALLAVRRLFSHQSTSLHPHQLAQAPSVADQLLHRTDATPERSQPNSLSFGRTEVSSVHLLSLPWRPPPRRQS